MSKFTLGSLEALRPEKLQIHLEAWRPGTQFARVGRPDPPSPRPGLPAQIHLGPGLAFPRIGPDPLSNKYHLTQSWLRSTSDQVSKAQSLLIPTGRQVPLDPMDHCWVIGDRFPVLVSPVCSTSLDQFHCPNLPDRFY